MKKNAVISDCGKFRYQLSRIWDESKPLVMFMMLNPSTADADEDDPTIRRCIGFAKSWGFGGLYVGNLFAFRATNPKELLINSPIMGDEIFIHLNEMSEKCEKIVCAWGNGPIVKRLAPPRYVMHYLDRDLHCIELSMKGIPKHPLYLKKNLELKPFTL